MSEPSVAAPAAPQPDSADSTTAVRRESAGPSAVAGRVSLRDLSWIGVGSALLSLLFVRNIRSADFWWHIATGRWMVENQTIPRTDPFSFTAGGQPWHYVSWPAEWLLYRVWDAAGAPGIVGFRVLCVFTVLVGLGAVIRAMGARRDVAAALLLAAAVVVQPRYTLDRPMLLGAVLLVFTLWIAVRWWPRGGWSIALVPAIAGVWLPVHGAGVVGVACGVGALASAALFRRERRWLIPGAMAAIASLSLLGVTSAGRDIVEHLFLLGDAGRVTELIQEWGRPSLADPTYRLPFFLIAVGTVTAVVRFTRDPLPAGAALLGAYLGVQHIRGLTEGVLLTLPMAAVGISRIGAWLEARGAHLLARVGPTGVIAIVIATHFAAAPRPLAGIPGVGLDDRRFPSDAIEVLRALPEGRTMNNMDIGGYLIWHQVPGGVFVDGRILAVYTAEQFDELVVATMTDGPSLDAVADQWDIRYAVASHVSVMSRLLMRSPTWVPVFHGISTSVYARRSEETALRRAGFPLFDELRFDLDEAWLDQWYASILADDERTALLVDQLADGVSLHPRSSVAVEVLRYLDARHPAIAVRVANVVEARSSAN